MTSRSTMRHPEGTREVGTARVRKSIVAPMTAAQRAIYKLTGNPPQSSALDETFDPLDPFASAPVVPKKAPKKSKYGNTKCESGGIKFDSKREMMRWHDLIQMQVRGEISELELQVPFVLAPAVVIAGRKRPALRYVADFVYVRRGEEHQTVEDVKGRVTEGYRIKRHLMAARGLTIVEIK